MERLSEELAAEAEQFADTVKAADGGWSLTVGQGKQIVLTGRSEAARRHIAAHIVELRGSHGFADDELREALAALALVVPRG